MRQRVVADGTLLRLRAAALQWGEEPGPGDSAGTSPVHLRWMINRTLGLPLEPFKIWRAQNPFDTQSKFELANNAEWTLVEIVGLPIDADAWRDTGYALDPQGLVDGGLMDPVQAAQERLRRGAPPKGWMPFGPDGDSIPLWQRPDENRFLETIVKGDLLTGLQAMLIQQPVPSLQQEFVLPMDRPEAELLPRLLLNDVVGTISGDDKPRGSWPPLGVMAMAAGSDPLAALALGFGTAIEARNFGEEIFMVTVLCTDGANEIELADVAMGGGLMDRVPKPTGLATHLARVTRAQHVDGIKQDSIAVTWEPPPTQLPPAALTPEAPTAVAYAVARPDRRQMLLTPRYPSGDREPAEWLSFVPGKPADAGPFTFLDHHLRGEINATVEHPNPLQYDCSYAVAGQDLFGRWSDWETTSYSGPRELPQGPTVISVGLDNAGRLTVDFSWNWSDRSPQFVELFAAWTDDPGTVVATVKVTFAGQDTGQVEGSGTVVPLSVARQLCAWGAEQDRDNPEPRSFKWTGVVGSEPGTRCYRWTTQVDVAFRGARWRDFGVAGLGQQRIYFAFLPGGSTFNTSLLAAPVMTRLWDDYPLPSPTMVIEAPQWASLPDVMGVSRFTLTWPGVPGSAGYLVYEATETALLSAANLPGPETTVVHHQRLKTLRDSVDIASKQLAFRRITSSPVTGTNYEVALPRGSKVMHFYAVTSLSENQIEGGFPNNNRGFFAVAVPQLAATPRLYISAAPSVGDPQHVDLRLELGNDASGQVEIYRTTIADAADDIGSMGPPLAVINVVGTHDFTDTTLIPGWLTQRYRAVAWGARDDILGLVEARSVPTPQVSVLVPPPPPVISGLAGNQPLSTATDCLVGWTVSAATPPNTRCIVEVRPHADLNQMPLQRVPEGLADAVPIALSNDMPSPETGAGNIYALAGGVYRAWVKRPTADATMVVTLKVKDSLGRMTRQTVVVEPLPAVPAPVFDPINWDTTCEVLRGSDYKRFYFKLEPVRAGDLPTIWGTDTYTDDSAIGVAALHAGRITRDGGHVAVEIRPAQQSYQGTTRNGVTSTAYGPWHGSYVFIGL